MGWDSCSRRSYTKGFRRAFPSWHPPLADLPAGRDPKLEWALRHPERFPLEVNRASREELLRVPGIGPRTANRLLRLRRSGKIGGPNGLNALRLPMARIAPFLTVDGRRLAPEGAPTRVIQLALPL